MQKKKFPFSRVYIEITNICNKSCSFCPGTNREPRSMSRGELITVLDKLCGLTEHIYFHLMGEPLMHPELLDFIAIARSRGFKPMLTTNGTLLGSMSDELIASGIYKVNISLHSFEGGTTDQMCEYISSVSSFAHRAADAGTIVTLRLWNGGVGEDNSEILSLLHKHFCEPWQENNRGATLRRLVFLEEANRFVWPDRDADELGSDVYCHGLGDHFGILSDGSIVPCCLDRDGVITLANAFCDDIGSAVFGERAEKIKNGFKCRRAEEELCRKCSYARRF